MLNRETPAGEQQPQVNNLNIQDQSSQRQLEDDHPMRGDVNAVSSEDEQLDSDDSYINVVNQFPLTTEDDLNDADSTDEDTEDEDEHEEEGAVGGVSATATTDPIAPPSESTAAAVNAADNAIGGGMITDMDPAVRAILGDLQVPEGVDPSFLAALPAEMRDEVIQEHVR
jgi:hypothetical protein